MIDRRHLVRLLATGLLARPIPARAQSASKVPRLGILTLATPPTSARSAAFRQGLREHGYDEGRNIALEFRSALGKADELPALAAELVGIDVQIIVTESNAAALAARQATRTIPIVMAVAGDPVKAGVVDSLARPGGNITGLTLLAADLSAKRLQLIKEVAPDIALVAVVWNPANPAGRAYLKETEAAAQLLGLRLQAVEVREPADLDGAFETVMRVRPSALLILPDGMLLNHSVRIGAFAAQSGVPGIFPEREFAEAGGLLAYGPSLAANFRRAAAFVDKILRGARPADLPIEQPTKLELVVNLKTAKSLGIIIPQSIQLRADEVIE